MVLECGSESEWGWDFRWEVKGSESERGWNFRWEMMKGSAPIPGSV
jgi:hypothetical protein